MDPTTERIINWLYNNIIQIIVISSIFIQITPIKWNPITSFIKWVGKILTQDVNKAIDKINDAIDEMREDIDENEKDRIRWEVLDFANSCRNGRKHSKDEFEHIVTLNDKYTELLKRTGDRNGVFTSEYEYINTLYNERKIKNDFLQ